MNLQELKHEDYLVVTSLEGRDRNRELVRIKFNRTCQSCGLKWAENERRLDIHHIDQCGKKSRGYDRLEDIEKGLEVLCHECHLTRKECIANMGVRESNAEKRLQRNKEIMKLNGVMPMTEIAQKFNISKQMVYLVVTKRKGWSGRDYLGGNEKWKAL